MRDNRALAIAADLTEDAINWTFTPPPARVQPIDLLALTDSEVLDAARSALADRDVYRALTVERDGLRDRNRQLRAWKDQLAAASGLFDREAGS